MNSFFPFFFHSSTSPPLHLPMSARDFLKGWTLRGGGQLCPPYCPPLGGSPGALWVPRQVFAFLSFLGGKATKIFHLSPKLTPTSGSLWGWEAPPVLDNIIDLCLDCGSIVSTARLIFKAKANPTRGGLLPRVSCRLPPSRPGLTPVGWQVKSVGTRPRQPRIAHFVALLADDQTPPP